MKLKNLTKLWNRFWFKEHPVDGICLFRILIGAVAISIFLQDLVFHHDLWAPSGLQSIESFRKFFSGRRYNLFHLLEGNLASLKIILFLHAIAQVSFICGYKTRLPAIVLMITMTSLAQRNIQVQNGADLLLRILLLIICFAPCGNRFSIDSFLAAKRGTPLRKEWAPWAHRLVQIQVAFVYLSIVYEKYKGVNWLAGMAIYYATRLEDFSRYSVPYILDNIIILKLLTWGTLLLELALGSLIFFDEFRKKLIISGILFHISIDYVMPIPTFGILMTACLLAMF